MDREPSSVAWHCRRQRQFFVIPYDTVRVTQVVEYAFERIGYFPVRNTEFRSLAGDVLLDRPFSHGGFAEP